jgi:hypothetical protein
VSVSQTTLAAMSADRWVLVPRDLLERASHTLNAFCRGERSGMIDRDARDDLNAALAAAPAAPAAESPQPLTDEQIDAMMPPADGTAEANVMRVEVLPGVMGTEYDEVDAWSRPLVRQVVRAAIERAHGIGAPHADCGESGHTEGRCGNASCSGTVRSAP